MSRPYLAVDDRWVNQTACARKQVHPPMIRPEPVLVADKPWERRGVLLYGNVQYDEQTRRFRMWYKPLDKDRQARVCYAESEDGLVWEKPELGLYEFEGSRANNIVYDPPCQFDGPCMIFDSQDEAAPYKMVFHLHRENPRRRQLYTGRSRDGLRWEMDHEPFLDDYSDRQQAMACRDRDGRFVVYARSGDMLRQYGERIVARVTSEDFRSWSEPQLVFKSLPDDPPMMEVYSLTPFPAPGDGYLGIYERMHFRPDVLDSELLFSPDGLTWQPIYPRTTFFGRGPEGSWRSGWLSSASNGPVEHDGYLYWFLSGRSGAHQSSDLPREPIKSIGLATSFVDRYASWSVDDKPGWVRTEPITWPGGRLSVNADTHSDLREDLRFSCGTLTVEVADANGKPVEGLSAEDCVSYRGNRNGKYQFVTWNSGRDIAELPGQSVTLTFRMQRAHLYSFRAQSD